MADIPRRSYGAATEETPASITLAVLEEEARKEEASDDEGPPIYKPRKRTYGGQEAQSPGDVVYGTSIAIVSPGGVGKTTLAGTLAYPFDPDELAWDYDSPREETSPFALFDDNSNSHMLPYSDRIDVIKVTNTSVIDKTITEFERGDHAEIKSLVWDNLSATYDRKFVEHGATNPKNQDQRSWYNAVNAWVTVTTRRLINLSQSERQLNVVFIFQEAQPERLVTEPTSGGLIERKRKEPSLSDKIQTQWGSMMPFMGFLYTASDIEDPAPRVLDFRAVSYSLGKKQAPLEPRLKLIPGMVWNPDLGHLIAVLHGKEEWNSAKHTRIIQKRTYGAPPETDANDEATQ